MSTNNPELSFEVIYRDDDLIQVEVKASNGRYAGVTVFYTGALEFIEIGEELQGFPKGIGQVIEKAFGYTRQELIEFQEKNHIENIGFYIPPYVNLKFKCIDKSGHTAVDIILVEENWTEREEAKGKVSFEMLFEPASLDIFSVELSTLGKNKKGKATLIGCYGN